MKLSVIVPVYNAQPYLRRCLDSLVGQTVEDFEIILVNDGSTDGSQTVIDEYLRRYPEQIVAVAVENGGQGRARNIGMELARGEYLGFVDSDDWIHPHMYARLLSAAEALGAELTLCGISACAPDGSGGPLPVWQEGWPLSAAGSASNKLFKRSLVGELRFPEGLWYEDFAFSALALLRARQIVYVDEQMYFYRQGHTSTMHNANAQKNLDILKIMELLKGPMLEAGRRADFEKLLLRHVLLDSVNRLEAQDSPDKETVIAALRAYVRENIPSLRRCESFRTEGRNRKIVMALNYHGREELSRLLLEGKRKLKRQPG